MTPRGEDVRTVVAAPASGASWSPDGSKFVYVGVNAAGDDTALWISRADGSGARRLALPGVNSPSEPSWAPDGALIAFVSPTGTLEGSPDTWNEDVFAVHPDGTGLEQLTTGRENDHWPPAWSPNGEALVYSTLDFEHQQDDLAWLDVATGDVEALTTTTGVEESNADWRR